MQIILLTSDRKTHICFKIRYDLEVLNPKQLLPSSGIHYYRDIKKYITTSFKYAIT